MTQEEVSNLKYDDALARLKDISFKLENKEISIDDLTTQVKLANMLSEHCKKKLTATEEEIKKIIDTDNIDVDPESNFDDNSTESSDDLPF